MLQTPTDTGLTLDQAKERLAVDGPNELPSSKPRNWFRLAIDVLAEPMFLLLVACAIVYLLIGDRLEACALLAAVAIIICITYMQEQRTERTLAALKDLSSPRAFVLREGKRLRIPRKEVVRGDVLILLEGDRIAADAELLQAEHLLVDESLLTGESAPVAKIVNGAERVYFGTVVVRGRGLARTIATGGNTEIGKIGKSIQSIDRSQTPLQRSTSRLVKFFGASGSVLCVLVVVVFGLTRGNWIQGLLAGITAAISLIPEEFPVILTIFLALAAWRTAQTKVLTRRIPAIEALGAATVLCVDKTGTLTQNRMTLSQVAIGETIFDLEKPSSSFPDEVSRLVKVAALASAQEPFDPTEIAIHEANFANDGMTNGDIVRQYPLSSKLMAMTQVWKQNGRTFVACKGAPEAVADLCHLGVDEKSAMLKRVHAFGQNAFRVLAVAFGSHDGDTLPKTPHAFDLQFLGLIAFADPVRPDVPAAVKQCYQAGIRVAMITGDFPETAKSIARQIGLKNPDCVVTGHELDHMSQEQIGQALESANIYARVTHAHKLLIVRALRDAGEVVAMTGDGVNDAPALKASDIGIAMGKRGTDVAREAADIVLVDDDFSSIVRAIREGRHMYSNIQNAMAYVMAIHVPIALAALVPVLLGWPLILFPLHVLLLELITDPACSILFAMRPEEHDTMDLPPRDVKTPLFTPRDAFVHLLMGFSVGVVTLLSFKVSQDLGISEGGARALSYATLLAGNLGLILSYLAWPKLLTRSLSATPRLAAIAASAIALLCLFALGLPLVREAFHFASVSFSDVLICAAVGLAAAALFDLLKLAVVHSSQNPSKTS